MKTNSFNSRKTNKKSNNNESADFNYNKHVNVIEKSDNIPYAFGVHECADGSWPEWDNLVSSVKSAWNDDSIKGIGGTFRAVAAALKEDIGQTDEPLTKGDCLMGLIGFKVGQILGHIEGQNEHSNAESIAKLIEVLLKL